METKPRSRGRPKITKISNHPVNGIVDSPCNINTEDPKYTNVMELLYDNPMIFSKILKLLRKYNAISVRFKFTLTDIFMYTYDHLGKNIIYIKLIGERINRYYCKEPFDISVNVSKFFDIMHYINNSYEYILFETNTYNKSSKISLSFKDADTESVETDIFELDGLEADIWDEIISIIECEDNYPIKIEMPHKKFKKNVNTWTRGTGLIRVEKIGHEHLMVKCNHKDGRGSFKMDYKNNPLITVISDIEEDDVFSANINLNYIKFYANTLVGDRIEWAIDMDRPCIFTSRLDLEETNSKKFKKDSERCIIKIIIPLED